MNRTKGEIQEPLTLGTHDKPGGGALETHGGMSMGIVAQLETSLAILDPENPDAEGFPFEAEGLVLWTKAIADEERLLHFDDPVKPDTDPLFLADERKADEWLKANPGEVLTTTLTGGPLCLTTGPLFLPETFYPIRYIKEGKNAAGLLEGLKGLSVELRYNTRANRAD